MERKIVPGVIDGQQALPCLPPEALVIEAAEVMRERRIGAVMVAVKGKLQGIVTERDMVTRLLASGLHADQTTLAEIMTPAPETLSPNDTALSALEKMQRGRYRHLPVVDGEEIVGMISVCDLFQAVRQSLEEELHTAEALIFGDSYMTSAQL